MKEQLDRAEGAVNSLSGGRDDRWYPDFHIAARAGWMNDPNGLSFFKNRFQVYFQHNPFGTDHGLMHWGHVSSPDLVTWRREPIAVAPSVEEDRDGVFSGSAVVTDDGNELIAYFTGNRWRDPVDKESGSLQVQMMAQSTDGVRFHGKRMVVDSPEGLTHFRDPKVWKQGDAWYMIFGACSEEMRGQVWLYTSSDMQRWDFVRVIFEDPDPDVFMLECPDMFPLGDKWVLIYCPMGLKPKGYAGRNGHNAGYVVGTWEPGGEFVQESDFCPADWGHNYYAPQTFLAPDGRRIVFGWMGAFTRPLPSQDKDGWSGQMTVPRVHSLKGDLLVSQPIEELKQLRLDTRDFGSFELGVNESMLLMEDTGPIEIEAEFDLTKTTSERVGFKVHLTPNGNHTFVGYDDLARRVFVDRRLTGNGDGSLRGAPFTGDKLKLRIFVDNGSVEVFANDGEQVVSSFSFPDDGPRAVELTSEAGSIAVDSLKIHNLGTIWADGEK